MRRALVLVSSVLPFALLATCRDATQVTLEITTDFPCPSRLDTDIMSSANDSFAGTGPATETSACLPQGTGGRIGSIVLVPSGDKGEAFAMEIVSALDGQSATACKTEFDQLDEHAGAGTPAESTCIRQTRRLNFIPHTGLTLDVQMPGACAGIYCPPGSTCVSSASCVPDLCDDDSCSPGVDAGPADAPFDAPAPSDAAPNTIFVSSLANGGANFGGVTNEGGADDQCRILALKAGLPNPSDFIAYLSTTSVSAGSRIQGARGWVRPDGLPVADTAAQLTSGQLLYPIAMDERGLPPTSEFVATGTAGDGTTLAGYTCGDWTSATLDAGIGIGQYNSGTNGWEAFGNAGVSCGSLSFRLYCLQAAQNVQVAVAPPKSSLLAFVSSPWKPANGLAGADTQCGNDAKDAGRAGVYRALLSDSTTIAASRFTLDAGVSAKPWVRPDGVVVANSIADFVNETLLAPMVLTLGGTYVAGPPSANGLYLDPFPVWTGSVTPTQIGSLRIDCSDWNATNVAGQTGEVGAGGFYTSQPNLWDWMSLDCTQPARLYCLQVD